MQRYDMFIDGERHEPATENGFPTDNPYRGAPWTEIAQGGPDDVDTAVQAAHRALRTGPWAEWTAGARGTLLHRLGDTVAAHARTLAETEVRDNGKLFTEMYGQVSCLAQWFRYYGGLADKVEGTVPPMDNRAGPARRAARGDRSAEPPTKVRALGVGLPHALVTATFGGLTEPIALTLKDAGQETLFFWYVTGCVGLTFLATLVVREPSRTSQLDAAQTSPTAPQPPKTAPLT